jgi:hypothetical protein
MVTRFSVCIPSVLCEFVSLDQIHILAAYIWNEYVGQELHTEFSV